MARFGRADQIVAASATPIVYRHRHSAPVSQGMTLVEILAVVVILGILATALTFGISGKMGKARHEIAKTQISQIVQAIETFRLEKNAILRTNQGLTFLSVNPKASWYLETGKLNDPWGNPFLYTTPGPAGLSFEVLSYGADNQPGGEDEDADVSSADSTR